MELDAYSTCLFYTIIMILWVFHIRELLIAFVVVCHFSLYLRRRSDQAPKLFVGASCAKIVILFFLINSINNVATGFGVPYPLIIIFRSGILLANVVLAFVLRNQRYSLMKLFSIVLITVGIILFMLAEHIAVDVERSSFVVTTSSVKYFSESSSFIIGITLMTFCLFGSAYMGIVQEDLYSKYGKHSDELMFNVHFLGLPLFIFVWSSISSDISNYSKSPNFRLVDLIEIPIPRQWFIFGGVILLQIVCIQSVYNLSVRMNSLQLTMILTLRKFLNLVFSFLIFQNAFTLLHFIGSAIVLLGSFQFYDGFLTISRLLVEKKKIKQRQDKKDN